MDRLEQAAGRTLMIGFDGTAVTTELTATLRRIRPGGVILFRRNLDTPQSLSAMLEELSEVLPCPTLFAVDQEGGRVSRLEPWLGPTPPAEQWARSETAEVSRFGHATGRALRDLGFNLDFAPVVDLCRPDTSNGIGDRSFGTDPELVTRSAGAFLDGLQAEGVAGCLKHFPGLGDTGVDSHLERPTVHRDVARLEREDLVPYQRLGSRAACVMVGHGIYPALTGSTTDRPACLVPEIVQGWLRDRLGYSGLVVTDDLEMGAVTPLDTHGGVAVQAIEAGCDLALYCHSLERAERARDALAARASAEGRFAARLVAAAEQVARTAARWPLPRPGGGAWMAAVRRFRETLERV